MVEARCNTRRQIFEKEDKVYGKVEKAEGTRLASLRQASWILAEEKKKVAEVWRLAYKNMAEKMADME